MTEVAMHPLSAIPSEDLDDNDVPFKILNKDNLPISIIGESIFKPFGNDYLKQKPNGIVYPTRRIANGNLQETKQRGITKSHGHVNSSDSKVFTKELSVSHGHLNHCNSAAANKNRHVEHGKTTAKNLDTGFTKTLDAKLRKLQKQEEKQQQHHGVKGPKPETPNKKPFITTVKKGHFLEPPPEFATLIGYLKEPECNKENSTKTLYAYASKPRVLQKGPGDSAHKARCETAARAAAASVSSTSTGLQGFSDNVQTPHSPTKKLRDSWLPYSGLTLDKKTGRILNNAYNQENLTQRKWNPNFAYAKLLSVDKQQVNKDANDTRAAEARRRAAARRRAHTQRCRRNETETSRRKREVEEADLFLKDLLRNPPLTNAHSQTDLNGGFDARSRQNRGTRRSSTSSASTQIYPGDLFDFEAEVRPILDILVGKTVEQALIEVLDEEELASLRQQQRQFLERRATEEELQDELRRIEEAATLKNVAIIEEEFSKELQKLETETSQVEREHVLRFYVDELLPNVLDTLKKDGLSVEGVKNESNESLLPWLTKEVTHELQEMIKSPDVLSDIVREILENRAELQKVLLNRGSQESSADEGPTNESILLEDINLKEGIVKIADKGDSLTTIS